MARTRKSTQLLNLKQYDVLIEDRSVNSDYFKISQFDGYLYGGRNSFLIAGTSVLRPNSKILVEVLNKDGTPIYSAPVSAFIEGNSRLISVEVYKDTPIGAGKIVILGCADKYIDGTEVPAEWKDKYNVRWVADVTISPLVKNKTPIRLADVPVATVEEKLYPTEIEASYIQRVSVPVDVTLSTINYNVFSNGYLAKLSETSANLYQSKYLNGKITGSVQFIADGIPVTASVDIPISHIFNETLAESNGSTIITSTGTRFLEGFLSSSGSYVTEIKPFGTVTVTSNLNIIYDELISGTDGDDISFAKIRITNVSTLSGEINSVEVQCKAQTDLGEFISVGNVTVNVSELLAVDEGNDILSTGKFNEISIPNYWYAASMSLSRQQINPVLPDYYTSSLGVNGLSIYQSNTQLIDSINATPEIINNTFIDDVVYFIGTTDNNDITLFPRSEYTLKFDAIVSKFSQSIELSQSDYSLQVYLINVSGSDSLISPDTRGQLLGTLTPHDTFTKQNFTGTEFNFKVSSIDSGQYALRFIAYGGFWNIAEVSVKVAQEEFFSPDEIDILVPVLDYADAVLTFKLNYLDVNNNSANLTTITTPQYFSGSGRFVRKAGDTMSGELFIKGYPIQREALNDAFTGLIDGGVIQVNTPASWSYTIGSGSGYVIDNFTNATAPEYRLVSWSQIVKMPDAFSSTGSVASYPRTNIAIDIDGNLIEQSGAFDAYDYRNYIVLGRIAHVGTTHIQRALSLPLTTYNRGFHWFDLANAIGIINVSGNEYYASGSSMRMGKTSGTTYRVGSNYRVDPAFPDITSDPASIPVQFAYRYRSGSVFAETPVTTIVSGNLYDNGSGVLHTVNPNKFTVQRIYYFGATNTTRILFGQNVYNTLEEAEAVAADETVTIDPNLESDAALRAFLVVGSSTTDLSNTTEAQFIPVGKFGNAGGGGGGGGGANNLFELNDVNLTGLASNQFLQYNGAEWVNGNISASVFGTSSWAENIDGGEYITGSALLSEILPSTINMRTSYVGVIIDGAGSAITVGEKSEILVPFSASIQAWTILADRSGSITLEVWKTSYQNYPPTQSNNIVSSSRPFMSGSVKNRSTTLTGWDTTINPNDTLKFYVSASSTVQRVNLTLEMLRL